MTIDPPPLPHDYIESVARTQAPWEGFGYANYLLGVLEAAVLKRIEEIRREEGIVPCMPP